MAFWGYWKKKDQPEALEFISIPLASLNALVTEWVTKLEVEETTKWCKCLWRIHPDDQGIRIGCCRVCNQNRKRHTDQLETHVFRGIRKVRVDDHPFCPVHTKEGLLAGFIKWVADGHN